MCFCELGSQEKRQGILKSLDANHPLKLKKKKMFPAIVFQIIIIVILQNEF